MWNHMDGYFDGWGWGGMLFGGVFMLLFWALVIAGIVFLVRGLGGGGRVDRQDRESDAVAILKERYARGEIDKNTYERMLKDIER